MPDILELGATEEREREKEDRAFRREERRNRKRDKDKNSVEATQPDESGNDDVEGENGESLVVMPDILELGATEEREREKEDRAFRREERRNRKRDKDKNSVEASQPDESGNDDVEGVKDNGRGRASELVAATDDNVTVGEKEADADATLISPNPDDISDAFGLLSIDVQKTDDAVPAPGGGELGSPVTGDEASPSGGKRRRRKKRGNTDERNVDAELAILEEV